MCETREIRFFLGTAFLSILIFFKSELFCSSALSWGMFVWKQCALNSLNLSLYLQYFAVVLLGMCWSSCHIIEAWYSSVHYTWNDMKMPFLLSSLIHSLGKMFFFQQPRVCCFKIFLGYATEVIVGYQVVWNIMLSILILHKN